MVEADNNIFCEQLNVWNQLEEGWGEFAKENKFGCVAYS